ncbi:MAG: replicative DNA helicase [Selenomonadaceae bacterium]|nr:replicative DNA helicase [Selenomonadaceae bacterium]
MEKFVLSAMLLKDGEIIPTITAILTAEDFYRPEHRLIFSAILKLYSKKIIPTILSLNEELRQSGELEKIGGVTTVFSLSEVANTTAYAETYAKTIKEKSILRKLIQASEEIIQMSIEEKKPLNDILDDAEKKIFGVTSQGETSEFEHIMPILQRSFDRIRRALDNPEGITGVPTKFVDFDRVTSGLQKSDLILLAARPSMGKTALALNMAMNAALADNVVAIFSLEMSKEQLGHRLLSSYSGINSQKLSTGNFDSEDLNSLIDTLEYLTDSKLFIDDTAGITILELRSKARKIKNEHGLNLIVIDYLQLMQGTARKGADFNRQQEISEISRNLKGLARELKVPILALSQLSRSVELRADKRPLLSDLRESGSLEQDADIVMFLYREEYYDKETENTNTAELVIAKNRNGPTTTINLQFDKECMRFGSLGSYDE